MNLHKPTIAALIEEFLSKDLLPINFGDRYFRSRDNRSQSTGASRVDVKPEFQPRSDQSRPTLSSSDHASSSHCCRATEYGPANHFRDGYYWPPEDFLTPSCRSAPPFAAHGPPQSTAINESVIPPPLEEFAPYETTRIRARTTQATPQTDVRKAVTTPKPFIVDQTPVQSNSVVLPTFHLDESSSRPTVLVQGIPITDRWRNPPDNSTPSVDRSLS